MRQQRQRIVFFLSMQGSIVFLNTTDDCMKFSSKVFVKVSQNLGLVVRSQIIPV